MECLCQGYNYERIDGGITGTKRQDAIDRFNAADTSVKVHYSLNHFRIK